MNRLVQLEQFLAEDPDDPFNSYALALEYLKSDPAKAKQLFAKLLESNPRYLPTYYPYAHLEIEAGNWAEAERIFKEGQRVATEAGDAKTLRELTAAFNDWLFERD